MSVTAIPQKNKLDELRNGLLQIPNVKQFKDPDARSAYVDGVLDFYNACLEARKKEDGNTGLAG